MNERTGAPFASIESARECVALLLQAIEETAADVGKDLRRPHRAAAVRRAYPWPAEPPGSWRDSLS